jgi:4-hydroxybenzoate polyprenyltransferase
MNKHEPLSPDAAERAIPNRWIPRRWKIVLSFLLGLLSVFLMFFLGEVWGEHAMFPGMAAYFLISQYLLSRANPQAVRQDWSLILALNSPLLASDIICLIVEPNPGAKLSALWMAILAVTCSYAGAGLAAKTARY